MPSKKLTKEARAAGMLEALGTLLGTGNGEEVLAQMREGATFRMFVCKGCGNLYVGANHFRCNLCVALRSEDGRGVR